jgi:hypothetical protein
MRMLAQIPLHPLEGLRDIHLPPPPGLWPPAPGWWALALLTIAALVLGVRHAFLAWRRGRGRRAAVRCLKGLREHFRDGETPQVVAAELSMLLRRAAMIRHPRARVAGLTGHAWLEFLDDDERHFSEGVGSALASAPYARAQSVDVETLLSLCESWLRRNA